MVQAWPGTEALPVPARLPVPGDPLGAWSPGSQGLFVSTLAKRPFLAWGGHCPRGAPGVDGAHPPIYRSLRFLTQGSAGQGFQGCEQEGPGGMGPPLEETDHGASGTWAWISSSPQRAGQLARCA